MPKGELRIEFHRFFGVGKPRGRIHYVVCSGNLEFGQDVLWIVLDFTMEFSDGVLCRVQLQQKTSEGVVDVRILGVLFDERLVRGPGFLKLLVSKESLSAPYSENHVAARSSFCWCV